MRKYEKIKILVIFFIAFIQISFQQAFHFLLGSSANSGAVDNEFSTKYWQNDDPLWMHSGYIF